MNRPDCIKHNKWLYLQLNIVKKDTTLLSVQSPVLPVKWELSLQPEVRYRVKNVHRAVLLNLQVNTVLLFANYFMCST